MGIQSFLTGTALACRKPPGDTEPGRGGNIAASKGRGYWDGSWRGHHGGLPGWTWGEGTWGEEKAPGFQVGLVSSWVGKEERAMARRLGGVDRKVIPEDELALENLLSRRGVKVWLVKAEQVYPDSQPVREGWGGG